MADQLDSASPPQSTVSTQPRVNRHLDGDEVLTALKTVCDSLRYSAGFKDKGEAPETGKTIILIIYKSEFRVI